jgi:hypothetical protein
MNLNYYIQVSCYSFDRLEYLLNTQDINPLNLNDSQDSRPISQ